MTTTLNNPEPWRRFSLADVLCITLAEAIMLGVFSRLNRDGGPDQLSVLSIVLAVLLGASLTAVPVLGRHLWLGRDWRSVTALEWAWGVPSLIVLAYWRASWVMNDKARVVSLLHPYWVLLLAVLGSCLVGAIIVEPEPPPCHWTARLSRLMAALMLLIWLCVFIYVGEHGGGLR